MCLVDRKTVYSVQCEVYGVLRVVYSGCVVYSLY